MELEDPIQGAVVEGTAQGEDSVAVFPIPPGTGAFEADMTDEAMGGLDGPRADGVAALSVRRIVDLVQPLFQVRQGARDGDGQGEAGARPVLGMAPSGTCRWRSRSWSAAGSIPRAAARDRT